MNWLLVALVCVVILAAPPRPDHFTMRYVQDQEMFTPREHAACVNRQITRQLSAAVCDGAVLV